MLIDTLDMYDSVMKLAIIHNPHAGSAKALDTLRSRVPAGTLFLPSENPTDLARQIQAARDAQCDRLAIAGGDGSVHALVNALGPQFPDIPVGILPLGTGNDLCRTLAIPLEPSAALDTLLHGEARALDVIQVRGDVTALAANAITGGFSGLVAAEVTSDLKGTWGPLAYIRGALGKMVDPPRYRVTIRFDDGPEETLDALNVVVANGRTSAGGVQIAPSANPEDGFLDVVIVLAGDTLDLSIVAAKLMEGDYLEDGIVRHQRARRVVITSDPPLPVSIDGERAEGRHFEFEILPRSLRIVVGAEYEPAPALPEADLDPTDDEPDDYRPRSGMQRFFGLVSALLRLGGRLPGVYALGFWLAIASVALFAGLTRGLMAGEWDALNNSVHQDMLANRTPLYTQIATFFTRLGDGLWSVLIGVGVIGFLVARRRYLDASTLVALLIGSALLEGILKLIFQVPRPDSDGHLVSAGWYSFPSGHATRGVAFYGGMAALVLARHQSQLWRWGVAFGLVCIGIGTCWSRLYLGVHWLTDVVGGAIAGLGWITACMVARWYAHQRVMKRRQQKELSRKA